MAYAPNDTLNPGDPRDEREAALVRRLAARDGAGWVDADNHEAFAARRGVSLLFFTGDPVRFPESLDVAVVLPELQRAFADRFAIGVVRRGDEDAIARRWGSQRWPALVVLRDGAYVGTLAGMMDWSVYLERVAALLEAPTGRAPIPLSAAAADAATCH